MLQIWSCPYFEGSKHICPLFSGFGFCRILIFSELGWHFDLCLDMVSAFDIPMVQIVAVYLGLEGLKYVCLFKS